MYDKIVNPKTNKKVKVDSKIGKKVLKNYSSLVKNQNGGQWISYDSSHIRKEPNSNCINHNRVITDTSGTNTKEVTKHTDRIFSLVQSHSLSKVCPNGRIDVKLIQSGAAGMANIVNNICLNQDNRSGQIYQGLFVKVLVGPGCKGAENQLPRCQGKTSPYIEKNCSDNFYTDGLQVGELDGYILLKNKGIFNIQEGTMSEEASANILNTLGYIVDPTTFQYLLGDKNVSNGTNQLLQEYRRRGNISNNSPLPGYNMAAISSSILRHMDNNGTRAFYNEHRSHGKSTQYAFIFTERLSHIWDSSRNSFVFKGAYPLPPNWLNYSSTQQLFSEGSSTGTIGGLKILVGLCLDFANGLKFLHDRDLLHNDIKPDNLACTLTWPKNGETTPGIIGKLIDLGGLSERDHRPGGGISTPFYVDWYNPDPGYEPINQIPIRINGFFPKKLPIPSRRDLDKHKDIFALCLSILEMSKPFILGQIYDGNQTASRQPGFTINSRLRGDLVRNVNDFFDILKKNLIPDRSRRPSRGVNQLVSDLDTLLRSLSRQLGQGQPAPRQPAPRQPAPQQPAPQRPAPQQPAPRVRRRAPAPTPRQRPAPGGAYNNPAGEQYNFPDQESARDGAYNNPAAEPYNQDDTGQDGLYDIPARQGLAPGGAYNNPGEVNFEIPRSTHGAYHNPIKNVTIGPDNSLSDVAKKIYQDVYNHILPFHNSPQLANEDARKVSKSYDTEMREMLGDGRCQNQGYVIPCRRLYNMPISELSERALYSVTDKYIVDYSPEGWLRSLGFDKKYDGRITDRWERQYHATQELIGPRKPPGYYVDKNFILDPMIDYTVRIYRRNQIEEAIKHVPDIIKVCKRELKKLGFNIYFFKKKETLRGIITEWMDKKLNVETHNEYYDPLQLEDELKIINSLTKTAAQAELNKIFKDKIISKNFSLDSAKKLLTDKAHGKYNDYEMNNDLESINANCQHVYDDSVSGKTPGVVSAFKGIFGYNSNLTKEQKDDNYSKCAEHQINRNNDIRSDINDKYIRIIFSHMLDSPNNTGWRVGSPGAPKDFDIAEWAKLSQKTWGYPDQYPYIASLKAVKMTKTSSNLLKKNLVNYVKDKISPIDKKARGEYIDSHINEWERDHFNTLTVHKLNKIIRESRERRGLRGEPPILGKRPLSKKKLYEYILTQFEWAIYSDKYY